MPECIPKCPSISSNEYKPPQEYVMYYHIKNNNINDKFYKIKNGVYEFLGKYTGYSTRPTYKSHGKIHLEISENNSIFIACKAINCPNIGWIVTEILEN